MAAASLVISAAVFVGLTALSRADNQSPRLQHLTEQAGHLVNYGKPLPASAPALPCRQSLEAASADVERRLRADIARANLDLQNLTWSATPAALPIDLVGSKLELAVSGDEPALTNFLKVAADERLPIFLDAVEVKHKGAGRLETVFRGRLLCRRAAS
jgi:hypothetical protein